MKCPFLRIIFILILLVTFIPNFASAQTKSFIKEYTFRAGDEDSKNSSRVIALREIKRLLLEELGTYLESNTEVVNFQLKMDQVTALTAGIVHTEILKEKWDGQSYWIQAKIDADPNGISKAIDSLRKDREKSKELEDANTRAVKLSKEIEKLKSELELSKNNQTKISRYKEAVNELSATDWHTKGLSLSMTGNYEESISAFTKAIELDPQYAKAYDNRAYSYSKLGNLQKTIQDTSKAIDLNPNYGHAYTNRGFAYIQMGNYQQAVKDTNRGVELDPKSPIAYVARGVAYFNQGNYQEAIVNYSKAIELDPAMTRAYSDRGSAYGALRNYKKCIEDTSKAIELDPQYNYPYYNRGWAYKLLGDETSAIRDWKIAAKLGYKGAQKQLNVMGVQY